MGQDYNSLAFVDMDDALKRVGGNKGLYVKLLGRFVDGNHLEGLDGAIAGSNMEEASHLAHTLKGVSSNLSLMKVAAISTDLEQLFKSGGDYAALYEDLKVAYKATIEKISEISA